jgi:hypothetical protein
MLAGRAQLLAATSGGHHANASGDTLIARGVGQVNEQTTKADTPHGLFHERTLDRSSDSLTLSVGLNQIETSASLNV